MTCEQDPDAYLARAQCIRLIREQGLDEKFFLKEVMRCMGMRTSLSRITIISLLFNTPDASAVSNRYIWAQMEARLGAAFEIRNLYGALSRIEESGIICVTAQRTYYLSAPAVRLMCQLVTEHLTAHQQPEATPVTL